jgi:hypothetical protein
MELRSGQARAAAHGESLHPSGRLAATGTTASLAVDYRGEDSAIIWFTGTSTPVFAV